MDFSFGKKSPSSSGSSGPSMWKNEGNFRTSLTEGSSRLFGSVLATKNGLIDGLSSKIDQVVNIVGGADEGSEEELAQAAAQPKQRPDQPKQRPDQPKQRPDQPKQRPDQPKQRPDQPKQRPDQAVQQTTLSSPTVKRPPSRPPAPRQGSTSSNGSNKQVQRQNSAPVGFENQYTDAAENASAPESPGARYPPRPRPMKRRNTNPFLNADGSLIADEEYGGPAEAYPQSPPVGESFLAVAPRDLLAITPTSGEALPPPTLEPQHVHHSDEPVVYDGDSDADSEATEGCDEDEVYEADDDESMLRSGSVGSDRSWASGMSGEHIDDRSRECMEFMRDFVDRMFGSSSSSITPLDKAQFGHFCQQSAGRLWFARFVNAQRVNNQRVLEQTFYGLVQHFAVALFECYEEEDFGPAKTLMNMCFTFYFEAVQPSGGPAHKHFLYSYLKEQPIWQSLRFWNAAFFDAVQQERARKPTPTRDQANGQDEREFQENVTFGQLGVMDVIRSLETASLSTLVDKATFTCNMRAFGLSQELCVEFLRKQSTIVNLKDEQVQMLRKNIMR